MGMGRRTERGNLGFGGKLRVLRGARGFSQTELAERSRVKRPAISEYESDKALPDVATIERLLRGMRFKWSALDHAAAFLRSLESSEIEQEAPWGEETASLGAVVRVLRHARGFSQIGLAKESGVSRSAIAESEEDRGVPDASTIHRILGALGLAWSALDHAVSFLSRLRTAETEAANRVREEPVPPAAVLALAAARERAPYLWVRLTRHPSSNWQEVVARGDEFKTWAFVEFLSIRSEELCSSEPREAIALAEFAGFVAEHVAGPESLQARSQGFAAAHLGNAHRVSGKLKAAEEAFARSDELWASGEGAPDLFEESRLLDLKASLRRAQRRLSEALDLLDRALAIARNPAARARVLLKKSKTQEESGDWQGAITSLYEAAPDIGPAEERLLLILHHNLVWLLTNAGRHEEARQYFPKALDLSRCRGGTLDRIRLRWVEARMAAERGETENAVTLFSKVRGEFVRRGMGFDTALISMELAVLYLQEGRTEDVKTLARQMIPIFKAQDIHREALAALALFRQAVEREGATLEFTRRMLEYLRKARHNPELHFQPFAS